MAEKLTGLLVSYPGKFYPTEIENGILYIKEMFSKMGNFNKLKEVREINGFLCFYDNLDNIFVCKGSLLKCVSLTDEDMQNFINLFFNGVSEI